MPSRRIQNRARACLSAVQAAFAGAEVVDEALTRSFLPAADDAAPTASLGAGVLLRCVGRQMLQTCRAMLTADAEVDRVRGAQRRNRRRRDRAATRLYREVVEIRRYLKGFHGRMDASGLMDFSGPTSRDPANLHGQARYLSHLQSARAAGDEEAPDRPLRSLPAAGGRALAADLEPLCDELEQALTAIIDGGCHHAGALVAQRRAMAEYDAAFQHGTALVEQQLDVAGLPTLRDSVRPGIGRRGRPRKVRPADLHPDLIERATAIAGRHTEALMRDLGLEHPAPAAKDTDTPAARLVAAPPEGDSPKPSEAQTAQDGDSQPATRRVSPKAWAKKIAQRLRKSFTSGEEIEQVLHKPPGSGKKCRQPDHKPPRGGEKSRQPLRKPNGSGGSPTFPAFTPPPPVREHCYRGSAGSSGVRHRPRLLPLAPHCRQRHASSASLRLDHRSDVAISA